MIRDLLVFRVSARETEVYHSRHVMFYLLFTYSLLVMIEEEEEEKFSAAASSSNCSEEIMIN